MNCQIICQNFVCENPPTNMCHGSTVLPVGELVLSAWFGGSYEGKDDVKIYLAKRESGQWSNPQVLSTHEEPHWNPVLACLEDGCIALYYKVGREIASWRTMVRYSSDCINWSNPEELVPGDSGGRGPVRCKTIKLSNSRLLAPASTENKIWKAFADRSDDNGHTWQKSNLIQIENIQYQKAVTARTIEVSEQSFAGRGVIQPTLWESKPGNIHMLMRSTEGFVYRSDSDNYGETWCSPYPTQLPNNNSGIDVASNGKGTLVLAYNPVGANWGVRTPLSLAISEDNGTSWRPLMDLESEEGEFSYPAIVFHKGIFHITYTWKRKAVAYWQVKLL